MLNFIKNIFSKNTLSNDEYHLKAKYIWQNYVPKSGQSNFIQGEMLRAIEKLRDEAQRNGNINFNKEHHGVLIKYLRNNLSDNNIFNQNIIIHINFDLDKLSIDDQPYLEDDIFDYIRDRIVDWHIYNNSKPIPHKKNSELPY